MGESINYEHPIPDPVRDQIVCELRDEIVAEIDREIMEAHNLFYRLGPGDYVLEQRNGHVVLVIEATLPLQDPNAETTYLVQDILTGHTYSAHDEHLGSPLVEMEVIALAAKG